MNRELRDKSSSPGLAVDHFPGIQGLTEYTVQLNMRKNFLEV